MSGFLDGLRDFSFGTMALRLALAMLCGGVLGYGRSRQARPAGLWTYMPACVGATAAVLLAETVFNKPGKKIRQTPEYTLEVFYNEKNPLDDVLRYCKNNTMTIVRLKIHTLEDRDQAQYAAEVQLRGGVNSGDMTERVERMPGIVSVVTL
ncbi:MAG: MgtC/SapB family protein [Clostridiales bacterium]|nr:MgtC/SapB family protein [Clostridiales bacterium]